MPYEQWEALVKFAHSSIKKYYANPAVSFETYCEKLTNLVSEVIGEKRGTLLDAGLSNEEKTMYLQSMVSKIDILYSNLFEECSEGLRFLPDGFIITDENKNEISSVRQLKRNITTLSNEFKLEYGRTHGQNHIASSTPRPRIRIPSRESFEIADGKNINLRAVHSNLTDRMYPFIDPNTTFVDFETAFSGAPVTNKVSWLYTNALHYFINNIHGVGVDRANEGQWKRASRCFTVNGKDITPDQIKDAGDPVASVTALLDRAIAYFL